MKAFVNKNVHGEPAWRKDPMTSAQRWRIQNDRAELGMPAFTVQKLERITKGEASDMIGELGALINLLQTEANEGIETYLPPGFVLYTDDEPPWE